MVFDVYLAFNQNVIERPEGRSARGEVSAEAHTLLWEHRNPCAMTATGGSDRADLGRERKPLAPTVLPLLLAGLFAYAVGVILYSVGWHDYHYFGLGHGGGSSAYGMMVIGDLAQITGVVLVALGFVVLVGALMKGVPRGSLMSIILGGLVVGIGDMIREFGYYYYVYGVTFNPSPVSAMTGYRLWEWGRWIEGAGAVLIIMGLVLAVSAIRKRRATAEAPAPIDLQNQ